MKVAILKEEELNISIRNQISELFRQLSPDKKQLALDEVLKAGDQTTFAYCELNGVIVGMASMCTYKVISGNKGWIEDVVVAPNARGKGIGRKLVDKLLHNAVNKKLSEILLFTEDHRTAAINLYSNLGFKLKNSDLYFLKLE